MTTFCPLRESKTEVRMRLSRGSFEVQTGQRHPMVGTPMEVPEPRTVNCKEFPALRGDVSGEIPAEFGDGFIGDDERDCKVFPDMLEILKMRGIDAAVLAAFGFGSLCGLGGECLV